MYQYKVYKLLSTGHNCVVSCYSLELLWLICYNLLYEKTKNKTLQRQKQLMSVYVIQAQLGFTHHIHELRVTSIVILDRTCIYENDG